MTKRSPSEKLEIAIRVVNKLRAPLLWLMLVTYPVARRVLSLGGVEYFLVKRTQDRNEGNPALAQLEQLLNDAVEIKIAVGEAGHS